MECSCINEAATSRNGGLPVKCNIRATATGFCRRHANCKRTAKALEIVPSPSPIQKSPRQATATKGCGCINIAATRREGKNVLCGRKIYLNGYCKIHQACKINGPSPVSPPSPKAVPKISKRPSHKKTADTKFVAAGAYGCVYRPAIPCYAGQSVDGKISKVMKAAEADEETDKMRTFGLARLDPGQASSIHSPTRCALPAGYTDIVKKTCSKKKYGPGPTVLTYIDGGEEYYDFINNNNDAAAVLKPLGPIFDLVAVLNSNRKYHMDIKTDNIVIRDGQARLIDYGLAIDGHPGERIGTYLQEYAVWPPELRMLGGNKGLDQISRETYSDNYGQTFKKFNIDIDTLIAKIRKIRKSAPPLRDDEILMKADVWGLGLTAMTVAFRTYNKMPTRAQDALRKFFIKLYHPDILQRPDAREAARLYRQYLESYFP